MSLSPPAQQTIAKGFCAFLSMFSLILSSIQSLHVILTFPSELSQESTHYPNPHQSTIASLKITENIFQMGSKLDIQIQQFLTRKPPLLL